jgi:hypothetical protein
MKLNSSVILTVILGCLIIISGCKRNSLDNNFSTDQKVILKLYASKYLSQEGQQLYVKSEVKSNEKKTGLFTTLDSLNYDRGF